MKVPFFRSPWQDAAAGSRVLARFGGVVSSGSYILGRQVADFERDFSALLGGNPVVAVNSGTDALVLALRLLDLNPGDEVILPTYTFFACYEAVVRVGAVPVLCDARADDYLSGAAEVAERITPRTRAVMAVPLFGDASALPEIARLCADEGFSLVEDAAQCCGGEASLPDGGVRRVGTFGRVSAFSFYPTKVLGAIGDAGALSTSDPELAARARSLRNHGHVDGRHHEIGCNSRMDELQAAVLGEGLVCLDEWLARRRHIARLYREALTTVPDLVLPPDRPGHAWNYFVVRHPCRDRLAALMRDRGIDCRIYYSSAIHQQPACSSAFSGVCLPNGESHARTALALPMHPGMTEGEVGVVVDTLLTISKAL